MKSLNCHQIGHRVKNEMGQAVHKTVMINKFQGSQVLNHIFDGKAGNFNSRSRKKNKKLVFRLNYYRVF
jgi:hypothetical protein